MNYIEIVRAVRSRVGMQGTTPSSISGAVGAEIDLVSCSRDAWIDIQNSRRNWKWMRAEKTFLSSSGESYLYTPLTIFGVSTYRLRFWHKDTMYYLKDGKRSPIPYIDYDTYIYNNYDLDTASEPSLYTVRPWDRAILFNNLDGVYTFKVEYQKSAQIMTTDSDIPELPLEFHNLIVYSAVEKYSVIVSSPELFQKYAADYARTWGDLCRDQIPEDKFKVMGLA